jgi:hypothetical protein
VSVGGLLALDQVLRNTWSYLTIFGTSMPYRRKCARRSRDHGISAHFGSFLGFWDNVMGKGYWPVGLPTLRPTFVICK